jgi:hypothetical protein
MYSYINITYITDGRSISQLLFREQEYALVPLKPLLNLA